MRDNECPHVAQAAGPDLSTVTPANTAQNARQRCHFCGEKNQIQAAYGQGGVRIWICQECLEDLKKKGKQNA